jgi:putative ABC transport system substrate-binding protein
MAVSASSRGRITLRLGITVLVFILLNAPLASPAQQPDRAWRIGLLSSGSASAAIARIEAFKHGLRELGYVEGQNLTIDYRWAEGREDRLPALATDLVRLKVDVIVTQGTLATLVARRTTTTTPIVFAVAGDPVGAGLVSSLARPGGTVTGLALMQSEMTAKQLELLRAVVPGLVRIAALWNPSNASSAPELRGTEAAARALGMQLQSVEARDTHELDLAFIVMTRQRAGAFIVLSDSMLFGQRTKIADLAAKNRLPAVAWTGEFVQDPGLLMTYGPKIEEMYRRAATYVDRILRGSKPADLPVEQPTKFEFLINAKTGKTLGLTIPLPILLQADRVIE